MHILMVILININMNVRMRMLNFILFTNMRNLAQHLLLRAISCDSWQELFLLFMHYLAFSLSIKQELLSEGALFFTSIVGALRAPLLLILFLQINDISKHDLKLVPKHPRNDPKLVAQLFQTIPKLPKHLQNDQ